MTEGVAKIQDDTYRIVYIINLNEYQGFFDEVKSFVNNIFGKWGYDSGYADAGIIAVERRNKERKDISGAFYTPAIEALKHV